MPLTPAQLATLRAHIDASADLNVYSNNGDGHIDIARLMNLNASPEFTVWRTETPRENILNAVVWTEFISTNTTQAERDGFSAMMTMASINMALPNIRQGFQDIFSGQQRATTRQAVINAGKRLATRAERLFATGIGTNGSPATMAFEGAISSEDVAQARAN